MKKILITAIVVLFTIGIQAQTLEEIAFAKIDTVNSLIQDVESQGKEALKEKMTVRTAEVFLNFANWDEENIAINEALYKQAWFYKNKATAMANELPDWERADVIKMLDEAIDYLRLLKNGKVNRASIPNPDWGELSFDNDQITYNGRPVFLGDYTWKPGTQELDEYHGQLDGFYMSVKDVNQDGTFKSSVVNGLKSKDTGKAGFVFLAHNKIPSWTKSEYGEGFSQFKGDPFHIYDVDNPGAKEMVSTMLKETAPHISGKKYSQLGYMLCNEPRWITYADGDNKVWYQSGVSEYTKNKFRTWLKNKHGNVSVLNELWETNFANFEGVDLEVPIDISMQETAQWYDWVTFNQDRITDWYIWMKAELLKYDQHAKVHLKIMPSFFTENSPACGIDFEALTELSEINGNDCAAEYNKVSGTPEWKEHYAYGWRETYMGYDFLKSVRPNQINFNSESHFLSTNHTRDLYMDPAYIRAIMWGATTLGLNATQMWYWPRNADGSLRNNLNGSYPGSNCQQPRVTNEYHTTLMDLNAHGELIMKMQRQRKPLRIFYSKTSATKKREYMDDVFELYEGLNFEGLSLGFATKNIINEQDNSLWDAVLICKTEYVTQAELDALQNYLKNGGTVIIDEESFTQNEYGKELTALTEGEGKIITVNSIEELVENALKLAEEKNQIPEISVTEVNQGGHKGCTWKCVKNDAGNNVLSIINMGKTNAKLKIELKGAKVGTACMDILNGIMVSSKPLLKPYEVYFVEVIDAVDEVEEPLSVEIQKMGRDFKLFPNPSSGAFTINLNDENSNVVMKVFSSHGSLIKQEQFKNITEINSSIEVQKRGAYLIQIISDSKYQTFRLLKN